MGGFVYSLGHKALAEFLACIFTCTIGEGLIANEHLPGTKGNGFGFGFIALGFGLSFAFAINMFGYISAHLNPGMCVCLWVAGKMPFEEVLVVSAAETAGWFVGACIVFVLYMPHFATVPQPQNVSQEAPMSTAVGKSAMQIASVQPTRDRVEKSNSYWARPDQLLRYRMRETVDTDKKRAFIEEFGLKVMQDMEKFPRLPKDLPSVHQDVPQLKRSKSIQIAVVHRALQEMDNYSQINSPNHRRFKDELNLSSRKQTPVELTPQTRETSESEEEMKNAEEVKLALEEAYLKALHADQHVKLAVFATTPAIPNIFMNAIQEFIGSVFLFLGAMLLDARFKMTSEPGLEVIDNSLHPLLIGFYVVIIVMSFGGPTSPSLNPARDLGPRFAHWVLPIPGKGQSNWWYAPPVCVADILGGAVAGGLYLAIDGYLNHEMEVE